MGFISDIVKANGARKAAKSQKNAIKEAKGDLNTGYDKAVALQQPYIDAGKQTIGQLASGVADGGEFNRDFTMNDFVEDPGYQFRLAEGQKGLERSAAARTGILNGATLKAATRYGQDMGSQEYQSAYQRFNNNLSNRFNRLSSVAQMGQRGTDIASGMESSRGTELGNLSINKGNVNAAKDLAYANAGANTINRISSAVGFPTSYGG